MIRLSGLSPTLPTAERASATIMTNWTIWWRRPILSCGEYTALEGAIMNALNRVKAGNAMDVAGGGGNQNNISTVEQEWFR